MLVVSGPSGVGKGTVITGLLEAYPAVRRSISCTTRPPRPGEEDGRNYYFISPERFERMQQAGEFLEWAVVHKDLSYGTPWEPVKATLEAGQDIVLEIDYQGARAVREQLGEQAVLVFIAPPSWDALLHRLQKRHTESQEDITKRLDSARREISNMQMYKYVIINDELSEAIGALKAILLAERPQRARWEGHALQQRLFAEAEHDRLL